MNIFTRKRVLQNGPLLNAISLTQLPFQGRLNMLVSSVISSTADKKLGT